MKIIITGISELAEKLLDIDSLSYLKTKINQPAELNPFANLIHCEDLRYIDPAYLEFEHLNIYKMKTTLRFYEWQSVDDEMPQHKDMVLIWRWNMPFVGYYDVTNNYWVIDGNTHIDGVEYWKDIQRP